ncbi:MAG: DUF3108 domain-containing protein [Candidatus Tectomicrobia bacterium]|nr:DUF3108 domain-containing protein [Candidatus Tectomicrobia bacterium]
MPPSVRSLLRIPAAAAALWALAGACGGAAWAEGPLPFRVGERLTFSVTWFGIPAGTSELSVAGRTTYAGTPVFRLTSTARSNEVFSLFYPVDDRFESFWDPAKGHPLYYWLRQREGSYRSWKRVVLDQESNLAFYKRNREPAWGYVIRYGVQDALSSLYKLRALPGEVGAGSRVRVLAFASKKNWETEVRVEARETLRTAWGEIPTLRVRPRIAYAEGPFRRKGEVLFWATADRYRIPVRMTSAVMVIGRVTASLTDAQGIAEDSLLAEAIRRAKDGRSQARAAPITSKR